MGGKGLGRGRFSHDPSLLEAQVDDLDRTAHRKVHIAQIRAMVAAAPRDTLKASELDDLLLMREEEKLARDVYSQLYSQWGLRPFGNIRGAEQAHMDAILSLLEHYAVPDPALGLAVGQFRRADLQTLHDDLVKQGLRSLDDAVRVGLRIEELDIVDLQQAAARTDKAHIRAVYADLERGSRNHLRAFYRWKQNLGVDYEPKHLPVTEFERIAQSAQETCA